MEDNIAFIKAELRALKSFVSDFTAYTEYGLKKDRIRPIKNSGEKCKFEGQKFKLGFDY